VYYDAVFEIKKEIPLYGTTSVGGGPKNAGTVWEITP
jgi:hypothetical protein